MMYITIFSQSWFHIRFEMLFYSLQRLHEKKTQISTAYKWINNTNEMSEDIKWKRNEHELKIAFK